MMSVINSIIEMLTVIFGLLAFVTRFAQPVIDLIFLILLIIQIFSMLSGGNCACIQ